ncbi:alpha/beta fold hydrolase [Salinibacillus xinjiangensis]|uniref:Alpha/beta fold hydrolase n=2 Tax=Salinibacillus xinjiangensis TaxID=1229268 RepID=A0A6G1XBG3_9BACI|nr:alpha/beta fold hydrolase [Salinibacillus xinjiangensis]
MKTFEEKQVDIQGGVVLKGTLTISTTGQGKSPAVLILPGTGKADRDGNINQNKLQFNLYRDLSEQIAAWGFITLRYDKRGTGESEGKHIETGMWDLVNDAQKAVQFLKEHPDVDENHIIVLGHSEGATLGTALAVREEIQGLILLSGGGEKIQEAMERQRELSYQELESKKGFLGWMFRTFHLKNKSEQKTKKWMDKVMTSDKDVIKAQLFVPFPAKWMREHLAYNVLEDLKKIDCPVLAITGSADYQADAEKLERVEKSVSGQVKVVEIENMDHMLKQSPPVSILKLKKAYIKNRHNPLHPELIKHVRDWLQNYR